MMHIDTQTFSAAEQAAQARARRERLGMAPAKPVNNARRIIEQAEAREREKEAARQARYAETRQRMTDALMAFKARKQAEMEAKNVEA